MDYDLSLLAIGRKYMQANCPPMKLIILTQLDFVINFVFPGVYFNHKNYSWVAR